MSARHRPIVPSQTESLNRRQFHRGVLAAAAATQCGLFEFASTLFADDGAGNMPKANVHVIVVRPKEHKADITWPGGQVDIVAMQDTFIKTLTDAAAELNVKLDVRPTPMATIGEKDAYLKEVKNSPPDGIIVLAMELRLWDPIVVPLAKDRGDVPTIVYSNMSTFTEHQQPLRHLPKVLLAATQDVEWLRVAVRMFHTMMRMKHARIAVVCDGYKGRTPLSVWPWGPTFHHFPESGWDHLAKTIDESAEMRAMADYYGKHAQQIVEPKPKDVLQAARVYVALRKIMQQEKCQGITCNCLPFAERTGDTACLAYSRMQDEGIVGCCEADLDGATIMLLSHLLLEHPAFIQDPSPNTINNTLIASHCTMGRKLKGFHDPYEAPYLLRDYHIRSGVAVQVLWPVGSPVTIVEKQGNNMLIGAGQIVSNIPDPPSKSWGGCRTSIEIKMDDAGDTRDIKGFHQLVIHGNHERRLTQFARLMGMGVAPISASPAARIQTAAARCACRCHRHDC
jgi:hypothetical protein